MTITITAGWWMIPTVVTAVVWIRAIWDIHQIPPATGPGSVFLALQALIYAGIATIISLAAWLIWALAR